MKRNIIVLLLVTMATLVQAGVNTTLVVDKVTGQIKAPVSPEAFKSANGLDTGGENPVVNFADLAGLLSYGQIDRTTTVVAEAATITIAANTRIKTTASGTLTTIAFSGGANAAQARRLDLDVTVAPLTLTIPTSRRLGESGSTTTLTISQTGYHELNWEYINGEYVMTDSVGTSFVSDAPYDATSWDADTTHASSKNALRDKFEALPAAASSILDGISSTRGVILYRGASGWVALAPGTSGYRLTTSGSGADPSWQSPSGGAIGYVSSVTTGVNLTATGPTALYTVTNGKSFVLIEAAVYLTNVTGGTVTTAPTYKIDESGAGAIVGLSTTPTTTNTATGKVSTSVPGTASNILIGDGSKTIRINVITAEVGAPTCTATVVLIGYEL